MADTSCGGRTVYELGVGVPPFCKESLHAERAITKSQELAVHITQTSSLRLVTRQKSLTGSFSQLVDVNNPIISKDLGSLFCTKVHCTPKRTLFAHAKRSLEMTFAWTYALHYNLYTAIEAVRAKSLHAHCCVSVAL